LAIAAAGVIHVCGQEGHHESGVSLQSEHAPQGSRVHSIDPPAGGENRPIDDVLKRGNYDLLAHRRTDVERVRETFFVPAPGWRGRAAYKVAAEITRRQRWTLTTR
jgi:hypothetical protein